MPKQLFWSGWAWLFLLLHAPSALAQVDHAAPTLGLGSEATPAWLEGNRPEPHADETWYGWQTLATDGIALTGLLSMGLFYEEHAAAFGFAALTGLGGYILGAPIVHAAHANWGAAVGSLSLRLLPFGSIMAAYGCSASIYDRDKSCEAAMGVISVLTFALPIVLDPALFAYGDAPKRREPQLWVAAWLDRSGAGVTLGDVL